MLDVLAFALGTALVVLAFLDALSTTLVVAAGAGPLTRRFVGWLWRGLLRLHRRDSESTWLTMAGPVLLVGTVLLWVAALWAGWTLIFLGGDGAVVDARTRAEAGTADVFYYSGFTVFTLGVGDFVGSTPAWRVVSALASFTGLFLVTLAITYLISVVSAVVSRRAIAIHINALGSSASEIVTRAWRGTDFSPALIQQLATLTEKLATTGEQHLAYPVLHFFHSRNRSTSAPVALAHLEDATLLLIAGVSPAVRPDAIAVAPVRHALERYITTASITSASPGPADTPPTPTLEPLASAFVPVVDEHEFGRLVATESHRRTALRELVNSDGWSWPQ